jgi:GTPase SAR1 family protein
MSATTKAPPDPLRLVLFGLPGAGKSSLLGALAQAAEAQPHLLDGRIADPSPNLADLRRSVYHHGSPEPGHQIVSYSFDYEPADKSTPLGAVVLDCDGRAADALIRNPAPIAGALSQEMLNADALVLAVDASAPLERLDADFGEFDGFLRRMEHHRGERTEIGGLPVFLVLTKCDKIARPGATTADWLEQIEERKREIGRRFRKFLAGREAAHQPAAFGRIHLQLWATAVWRPSLAGAEANPADPYGVAELFRQCLDQAATFRERRDNSAHRLVQMTLATVGGVLALLVAAVSLVAADALHQPPSALQIQVESLRSMEAPTAVERLRGSPERLRPHLDQWRTIHDDSGFTRLPASLRVYGNDRLSELETYIPWLEKLEESPPPRETVTEEELRDLRAELAGPLAPPRSDWDATDAGRLWAAQSAEAKALLTAIEDLRTWYQRAYDDADALWTFTGHTAGGLDWTGWARDVEKRLDPARKPPHVDADAVAGVDPPLTYAVVKEFGSVAAARGQWEAARGQLRRLRDVGAVLGLIDGLKGKPAVFVVPADGLTLQQADERFQQLRADYPDYEAVFTQGRTLPAAAAEVRARARANYERLLEPARALVLLKLHEAPSGDPTAPDRETRPRWLPVREWLKAPAELAGWRGLAWTLARLADPGAPEPVNDLASFLDKDTFSININTIILIVPDALEVRPLTGEALRLVLTPSSGGPRTERTFNPSGEGARVEERPFREYLFEAEPGGKLDYAPGDNLYAALSLADRKAFRWDRSRSRLYRFEALRTEPALLERDKPSAEGKDVRLQTRPDGGAPKVPDLMPFVDLK